MSRNIKNTIDLCCGYAFYIKYKHYEGICKEWRNDRESRPLKAIKALEYLHRFRDIRAFEEDFPQFALVAETNQSIDSLTYRIHL